MKQLKFFENSNGILVSIILFLALVAFSAFDNNKVLPLSVIQIATDSSKDIAYFVNQTDKSVRQVDMKEWKDLGEWRFENKPTGIVLSEEFAFVTSSYDKGQVDIFDLKTREKINTIVTGMGATSPVLSPDGKKLYVCNQFTNDVSIIDLKKNKQERIKVLREPFSSDVTPDGRYLYVANFLPHTRADIDVVTAHVSIIDLKQKKKIKDIPLSNGSNALRSLQVTPDGNYAMIVHNLGRHQVPTSQLEQGWMNTSALSVIDVNKQEFVASVLLDQPEYGAAGSWGLDITEKYIAVTHSGTHDVSIIDYPQFIDKLRNTIGKESLSYDLRFLNGIRERRKIEGNGPRFVQIYGDKLLIPAYFSDTLNILNIADHDKDEIIALNPQFTESIERKGEKLFNDAQFCFQGWQSCNGCHPGEARTDGLNWDLLNDGIGNPKNVKSLLYAHKTPPSMISGIRADAEVAVRAGFRHIQFTTVSEEQASAVDAYLMSLEALPSPYLVDGELSENALRGKQIFNDVGCSWCHSGEYMTDNQMHVIGEVEFEEGWNTPTLREVWRTAPYYHDGRYATVKEFIVNERHGMMKSVSDKEIDMLVEYVLSL
ncbi:c-type cytochrome [Aureibacter tunicatorum]|uniref:YVTN family beta-propeller protein n=1 Tax=Aureibacter tunicatorum TaxID=866807 RepID=A0AAE3XTN5_9BACT|nr:c-type cytochrome [Aureibacter tunicatorum]MDR6241784.1 YVTN family beta-propeller protein [Aureibacter tunicatorum]BDD07424.1 hypothetical protein AUTU_49070 [Aureibacter tunicatorum]